MTQKQSTLSGTVDSPSAATRKPYHRPAIVTREPMEVLAALCTGTSGGKSPAELCNPAIFKS